jgi:hypothetical protein
LQQHSGAHGQIARVRLAGQHEGHRLRRVAAVGAQLPVRRAQHRGGAGGLARQSGVAKDLVEAADVLRHVLRQGGDLVAFRCVADDEAIDEVVRHVREQLRAREAMVGLVDPQRLDVLPAVRAHEPQQRREVLGAVRAQQLVHRRGERQRPEHGTHRLVVRALRRPPQLVALRGGQLRGQRGGEEHDAQRHHDG